MCAKVDDTYISNQGKMSQQEENNASSFKIQHWYTPSGAQLPSQIISQINPSKTIPSMKGYALCQLDFYKAETFFAPRGVQEPVSPKNSWENIHAAYC